MQFLENRTFEELHIGDSARLTRMLTAEDVEPQGFGAWDGLLSELLYTELPGPGTQVVELSLKFRRSVDTGETVTARIRVRDLVAETRGVSFGHRRCTCSSLSASGS